MEIYLWKYFDINKHPLVKKDVVNEIQKWNPLDFWTEINLFIMCFLAIYSSIITRC